MKKPITIIGSVGPHVKSELRLDERLNWWIKTNCECSKNTFINYAVNELIKEISPKIQNNNFNDHLIIDSGDLF